MFHYMEYIYCVYLESSFSKAAERIHISQPSLSAAIKKAETEIGMPIFNRKTNPISLTDFGVEYIHSIEQVQEMQERLQSIANEIREVRRGRLSVGASNLSITSFISKALGQYKKEYPSIELQLFDTSTSHSLELLSNGKVDIVFTNRPVDTQKYERVPCYAENLIVAVSKSIELPDELGSKQLTERELQGELFSVPKERCVTLREFANIPFILLEPNNYLRFCTDSLFQESGVEPKIVLETGGSSTSLNFANLGVGATICSNWLVAGGGKGYDLSCFKIAGELARRNVYICYRRGEALTYAAEAFIRILSSLTSTALAAGVSSFGHQPT